MILRVWVKNYGGLGGLALKNERRKSSATPGQHQVARPNCQRALSGKPAVRQDEASKLQAWRGVPQICSNHHLHPVFVV